MRITSLEFKDADVEWSIRRAEFFPDVTLLVGLSGVGKTRILDTIRRLTRFSKGKTGRDAWGTEWKLAYEQQGSAFEWTGKFEARGKTDDASVSLVPFVVDDEDEPKPRLLSESLDRDGKRVASRDQEKIFLNDKETPKLSQNESFLSILKNEEGISTAYEGLDLILHVDHSEIPTRRGFTGFGQRFKAVKQKLDSIEKIRNEEMPTLMKLALAYENCRKSFDKIVSQFIEAFPFVEEVKMEVIEVGPFGSVPRIQFREHGVSTPIATESISSGMHRTLLHLSRMELWPDGMVVLIDEFENSFGVNCIDFVMHDLLVNSTRQQFILTSHHPYVINSIGIEHWKVVRRKGGFVQLDDCDLDGTQSSHEAFMQLVNSPEYSDGIAFR